MSRPRILFFTVLLAAVFWPRHAQGSTRSNNSIEVDIISPTAGGRYRVNQDRGIAVVIAVQNKRATERYGWHFDWEVRSVKSDPSGKYLYQYLDLGGIGEKDDGLYPTFDIQDDGNLYVGLTHSYLYANGKPNKPMPPGEYIFSWKIKTGPTCYSSSGSFSVVGDVFGSGTFNLSVADDAPWPDFAPMAPATTTRCASLAGQASFSGTGSYITNWTSPTTTPLACGVTETVTETPDPCRATVGREQARSISSIMTWVDEVPVTQSSATQTGPESATTKPSSSSSSQLRASIGALLMLLGLGGLLQELASWLAQ